MLDADRLSAIVTRHVRQRSAALGLESSHLRVNYVLNPGGFVNASFQIGDGRRTYHLKLADAPHRVARLRRWYALREPLQASYRAPHVVDWIDLPEAGCHGMLFEQLAGRHPRFCRAPALLGTVFALAVQLHRDAELTDRLTPLLAGDAERVPATHGESFVDGYVDRFRVDLEHVAADRPAFVSPETLAWMQNETEALAQAATDPAFATPAMAPVHGDLNELNVLVAARRRWYVLDWDDLTLGDPALDYAMLLWPAICDRLLASTAAWRAALPASVAPPPDPVLDERIALYLRAQSLDEVVDSLANYLDASASAEHRDQVRAQTRREHVDALRRYRAQYG